MTDPCPQYQKTHVYIDYYMSVVGDPNPITQTIKAGDFIGVRSACNLNMRCAWRGQFHHDMHQNL